jgi:hypothetical protein
VEKNVEVVGVKIKSIKRLDKQQDVYCLATKKNGNMIANGIIVKNCDALRYAVMTHKIPKYYGDEVNFGKTLGFKESAFR